MLHGKLVEKELQKGELKTGYGFYPPFCNSFSTSFPCNIHNEDICRAPDSPCTVLSLPCEMVDQQDSPRPKRKKHYHFWKGTLLVQDATATTEVNVDEYQPKKH